MKPQHFFVWFVVVSSSIAGGAFALMNHDRAPLPINLPALEGQTASPLPSASPALNSPSQSSTPATNQYQPVAPEGSAASPAAPRQPIVLRDQVSPGSAFDQFRSQFRQAVRDRDIAFVKNLILPEGIAIGFGVPMPANQLRLEDPNSRFWGLLEKALAQGCAAGRRSDYPNVDVNSQVWICPNVSEAFNQQYPNPGTEPGVAYEISRVIVVGDRVNVRAEAAVNSAIVGMLSNEVVQFDQQAFENFPLDQREAKLMQPADGWTPVVLPNGQRGFVYSRYAYHPLETRLILGQINGAWKILYIPSGD